MTRDLVFLVIFIQSFGGIQTHNNFDDLYLCREAGCGVWVFASHVDQLLPKAQIELSVIQHFTFLICYRIHQH